MQLKPAQIDLAETIIDLALAVRREIICFVVYCHTRVNTDPT
jgi:hypothetical protein